MAASLHRRLSDRLQPGFGPEEISRYDSVRAALSLVDGGKIRPKDPLDPGQFRSPDRQNPVFLKRVRAQVDRLFTIDWKGHVLFRHLSLEPKTGMREQILHWDIHIPEGQPSLDPRAAQALADLYDWLEPFAFESKLPLLPLEGPLLGHSVRVGIYSALLAQKLGDPSLPPDAAAQAGFLHDLGRLSPRRNLQASSGMDPFIARGMALWDFFLAKTHVPPALFSYRKFVRQAILEHPLVATSADLRGFDSYRSPMGKIVAIANAFDEATSPRPQGDASAKTPPPSQPLLSHPKIQAPGNVDLDLEAQFHLLRLTPVFHDI